MLIEDEAILSTFLEFFQSFAQPVVHKTLQTDPTARVNLTGLDDLFFNNVCLKKPTCKNQLIQELKDLQRELNKPLLAWVTAETESPEQVKALLAQHFESPGAFYGMLLQLQEATLTEDSNNVSIQAVQDAQDYASFAQIFCETFHLKNVYDATVSWLNKQHHLLKPTCINYLARVDGQVAGICSLAINRSFTKCRTGGFYNACVLPQYRNRGVATAMACHRVRIAQALGLQNLSIVLMSDAMARGYCERLGFKNYKTLTPYIIR